MQRVEPMPRPLFQAFAFTAVSILGLVACESDTDTDPAEAGAGTGASGGFGGSDGGASTGTAGSGGSDEFGMGGSSTIGEENQPDHDALATCGAPTCMELFAQRIEGGSPATINHSPCVLTALRDRTVGAYDVTLDHTWTNGSWDWKARIYVTASGDVELGVVESYRLDFPDGFLDEDIQPTQRCTLKDAAFFDACLGYVEQGDEQGGPGAYPDEAFACVYPDVGEGPPWFVDCERLPPTCE